ncbi:MAG: SgcJ/EcaC family oxidoreductase [Lewinellaceae bacterium]|nr:SgcJ/EcaC family oxidoreductase [Lewinellaceae bacterium]
MFGLSANAQKTSDEKTIRNLLDTGFKYYYSGEAEKLGSLYAENVLWIDYTGKKNEGRETLIELMKKDLAEQKPTPETFGYAVENIRFLSPDHAIVLLKLRGVMQMGDQTINWEGYDTMVFSRLNNNWLVTYEVSTPIMPPQG